MIIAKGYCLSCYFLVPNTPKWYAFVVQSLSLLIGRTAVSLQSFYSIMTTSVAMTFDFDYQNETPVGKAKIRQDHSIARAFLFFHFEKE